MANVGQVRYNVIGGNGKPLPNTMDIFSDIVTNFAGATSFRKVGIQADPGTKIIFNQNKEIIVGRTGIYELDDDIPPIEHMWFLRPVLYELNSAKTEWSKTEGERLLNIAETARQTALNQLYSEDLEDNEFWERYIQIDEDFRNSEEYLEGLRLYKEGVNGIYDNVGQGDLTNVIVDFVYE